MRLQWSVLVIIILFANIPLFAQSVDTAWVRRYNGPGEIWGDYDKAVAIALGGSGNVYVTGNSSGGWTTGWDYATVKYDSDGNVVWVRRYNGPVNGTDRASAIALDDSGNAFVTGWSPGTGTHEDYTTIKYDLSGNQVWLRRYNGPGNHVDRAYDIAIDASGNVYVTGNSKDSVTSYDYATVKYDPDGNELWVRRYNSPANLSDRGHMIVLDDFGHIYITGSSMGIDTVYDYLTVKYDSSGNELWKRRYNGPVNEDDLATAIDVNSLGNVYVTGYSIGIDSEADFATIKYDTSGNEIWVRRYNGSGNRSDIAHAMVVDDSGNVYITGSSQGNETRYDYATIKYDQLGNELWVRRYDRAGLNESSNAIALDYSDNIYVTGSDGDYATLKYDTDGNEIWIEGYNGPGNLSDEAYAIAVDSFANVYVTGGSVYDWWYDGTEDIFYYDYVTIKYIQKETSVEEQEFHNSNSYFSLNQNYPNPFNLETKIEYYLPNPSWVTVTIYNIIGQKVKVLADEFQIAGTRSVTWDGKDTSGRTVASGIYVYKLKTDKYVESKKMLLLK
jgi:hypothetical protein